MLQPQEAELVEAAFLLLYAPALHLSEARLDRPGRMRKTDHLLLWVVSLDLRLTPRGEAAHADRARLRKACLLLETTDPDAVEEALNLPSELALEDYAINGLMRGLHALWPLADATLPRLPEPLKLSDFCYSLDLLLGCDASTRVEVRVWVGWQRDYLYAWHVQQVLALLPVRIDWAEPGHQALSKSVARAAVRMLCTGPSVIRQMCHLEGRPEPDWLRALQALLEESLQWWHSEAIRRDVP
jgi:hypothetical protein